MRRRVYQPVAGFSDTLAKVRKVVHSIFPRELSPSRLAEKYASDLKKKGAAKVAAAAAESDAHVAAGDELLQKQLDVLQAALPSGALPLSLAAPPATLSHAAPKATNYTPWIVGGVAGVLAIILATRGRS